MLKEVSSRYQVFVDSSRSYCACEPVSSFGCLGLSSVDAPSVSVRQLHTLQRAPD